MIKTDVINVVRTNSSAVPMSLQLYETPTMTLDPSYETVLASAWHQFWHTACVAVGWRSIFPCASPQWSARGFTFHTRKVEQCCVRYHHLLKRKCGSQKKKEKHTHTHTHCSYEIVWLYKITLSVYVLSSVYDNRSLLRHASCMPSDSAFSAPNGNKVVVIYFCSCLHFTVSKYIVIRCIQYSTFSYSACMCENSFR